VHFASADQLQVDFSGRPVFPERAPRTGLRMIGLVRDSPASSCSTPQKLLICHACDSGIEFAVESCRMGSANSFSEGAPRPRGAGRPSTVAQYAPQVTQWLREDPEVSGAKILRRLRLAGYHGGKSALYELVRRLRPQRSPKPDHRLLAERK
jgi:hypothetical protein